MDRVPFVFPVFHLVSQMVCPAVPFPHPLFLFRRKVASAVVGGRRLPLSGVEASLAAMGGVPLAQWGSTIGVGVWVAVECGVHWVCAAMVSAPGRRCAFPPPSSLPDCHQRLD